MTLGDAAGGGPDVSVAVYEQLRLHVLEGAAVAGGHCALVVLLREGMAAWIARRTACPPAPEPAAARERPVGAPLSADDLHASLVRVLAGMAMSATVEMSR